MKTIFLFIILIVLTLFIVFANLIDDLGLMLIGATICSVFVWAASKYYNKLDD